ncbi:phosphodiester glycosidase family protein [Candidatus Shapirobacteria bacterium]|nr:phosphodiester glycosidase family protein [Candidatus Shapirobacteria bacterium]
MKKWLVGGVIAFGVIVAGLILWNKDRSRLLQNYYSLEGRRVEIEMLLGDTKNQLTTTQSELDVLKSDDQIKINKELTGELKSLKEVLKLTIGSYEDLIDLRSDKKQLATLDKYFAQTLDFLGKENYASASASLKTLNSEIKKEADKRAVTTSTASQSAGQVSGTQIVKTSAGDFSVRVISADLKTTKVVVDTASDKDCGDNCPVMPLATFASRSGAFAGINGPYFCPASYPACATKKNSFDTLMMNKAKYYFNSGNNVYSAVPAGIFSTTSRFVRQSSEWGRDTGVDSVIAGQPMLVFNGESQFGGDGDPKKSGKGTRAFIGATESTVYIGLVYNATVAEMANVVKEMGIRNAINLDSGGSIAMWQNGKYVAGPGRDLPFGILLVRR